MATEPGWTLKFKQNATLRTEVSPALENIEAAAAIVE